MPQIPYRGGFSPKHASNAKDESPTQTPGPTSPREPGGYYTTEEAAKYLRVSKRWLEKLRQIGGGPMFSKPGKKKVLYLWDDLVDWVARSKRPNTSQSSEPGRPE